MRTSPSSPGLELGELGLGGTLMYRHAIPVRRVTLSHRTLVLFGSPAAGTPVMVASPLSALDLPLKIVVWADGPETKVSYVSPRALASRYQLAPELVGNLAAINALTDRARR